ncbi:GspE/PulE family protein [Capsulimonas corticalis]|nr:GspE/PulE family protein [Capsulimonas corticalis]
MADESVQGVDTLGSDDDRLGAVVDRLVRDGIQFGSSDIHFRRKSNGLLVRYRRDGVLHERGYILGSIQEGVIARLKTQSGMQVSEKRGPQDGKITLNLSGEEHDLRVLCFPTFFGESVVIRVADKAAVHPSISNLDFDPEMFATFERLIARQSGMVIVTGPGGSGKTSFLYSCLSKIDAQKNHVVTVEDPIELLLPGATQFCVNRRAGMTFAEVARSSLSLNPDILFVGECRDMECAQIAADAALTGRLVMTTMHMLDTPATLRRLIDMGVSPSTIAAAVKGIVSLRLIRRLCPECKATASFQDTAATLEKVRWLPAFQGCEIEDAPVLYRAVGCSECRQTGYQGRIGLQEVLACDSKLVTQLLQSGGAEEMRLRAVASGMRTLVADGVRKAIAGKTTIEELLRATGSAI